MKVFDFNLFANDNTIDPDVKQNLWRMLYKVDGARVRQIGKDQGEITPKAGGIFKLASMYVSMKWTKHISLVKYLKWKKERDQKIKEGLL